MFYLNKNAGLNIKKKWNKKAVKAVTAALALIRSGSLTDDLDHLVNSQEERVVDCDNRLIDGRPGLAPETVEYSMAGIYKLWECVVYSHTEDDFNAAWEKLKAYFP